MGDRWISLLKTHGFDEPYLFDMNHVGHIIYSHIFSMKFDFWVGIGSVPAVTSLSSIRHLDVGQHVLRSGIWPQPTIK